MTMPSSFNVLIIISCAFNFSLCNARVHESFSPDFPQNHFSVHISSAHKATFSGLSGGIQHQQIAPATQTIHSQEIPPLHSDRYAQAHSCYRDQNTIHELQEQLDHHLAQIAHMPELELLNTINSLSILAVSNFLTSFNTQQTEWDCYSHARCQALRDVQTRPQSIHHLTHTPSRAAIAFLQQMDTNAEKYLSFRGNALQVALYRESTAILEKTVITFKDERLHEISWLLKIIGIINDAGFDYTTSQHYARAISCFDWCWSALETTQAIATGVIEGTLDGAKSAFCQIRHPLETAEEIARSTLCLAQYTGHLLAEMGHIVKLTLSDPLKSLETAHDIGNNISHIISALYDKAFEISARDYAYCTASFATDYLITGKVLFGLSSFIQNAHRHAKKLAHLPHAERIAIPAIITSTGNVFHQASCDGIDQYLSFLKYAKDDVNRVVQKSRTYISKARYAYHCTQMKARMLPELVERSKTLKLNITPERISHIIWGEKKCGQLSGCHTLQGLQMHKLKTKFLRNLPGGAYEVKVRVDNEWIRKTLFPDSWTYAQILEKIAIGTEKTPKNLPSTAGRTKVWIATNEGFFIETIVATDGFIITAYPVKFPSVG